MKKIIILLFLLLPAFAFAQNKLTLAHFWSIPWGLSIERVEEILLERGLTGIRDNHALITTADYEGEEGTMVFLFSRANRFHSGIVIYPASENNVLDRYDHYRLVLARRYGMPDTAVEFFEPPFQKGDGKEVDAIMTDNAFYFTEWEFGNGGLASVTIFNSLDVGLTFRNPGYADRN
ncbi:MAG: hypothetical protein FWG77_06255 [Treponema sp.]|nr:hypothetical protein [Treponema sp.]